MDTLINNLFDRSLANDFILNLKLPFNPLDHSGYKIAVSSNKISHIKDEQLRINITSYYESEYNNSNRYITYLIDINSTIFSTATAPSEDLKPDCDFACLISGLLQDPSFKEMLNSYMRLYTVVLNDLEDRQQSAQQLIDHIDKEMDNIR